MLQKNANLYLKQDEKDAILLHVLFTVLCGIVMAWPAALGYGPRFLFLVIVYNLALPLLARKRGYAVWIRVWQFALPLSIFQVFPDWFLSSVLNVLVFPEDGLFKIGTVSAYMAGLWTIPISIILLFALAIETRFSPKAAHIAAGAAAAAVFVGSEQTLWLLSSWYARDVRMIGHVALYIILPEILLGAISYHAYRAVAEKNLLAKIAAAFLVMQLYLGSAAFFYLLMEH